MVIDSSSTSRVNSPVARPPAVSSRTVSVGITALLSGFSLGFRVPNFSNDGVAKRKQRGFSPALLSGFQISTNESGGGEAGDAGHRRARLLFGHAFDVGADGHQFLFDLFVA